MSLFGVRCLMLCFVAVICVDLIVVVAFAFALSVSFDGLLGLVTCLVCLFRAFCFGVSWLFALF